MEQKQTIAIIGGTGKEGQGLAYRWLRAGHKVIIGSRSAEKAISAIESIKKMVNSSFRQNVFGAVNSNAAEQADIVVLTVPYKFHEEMVLKLKPYLSGKVFMDVSVPLVPPKVSTVTIPKNGSAAKNAKHILGEEVEVNIPIGLKKYKIKYLKTIHGNEYGDK
jgi:NADPH-dependent F420 reductase